MTERIRLEGQTAIVTGGGGGIGRGCAIRLAEAGANVVIADIVPERCEEVAARVREAGAEALPYPLDMTDGEANHAMIAAADDSSPDQSAPWIMPTKSSTAMFVMSP